MTIPPCSSTIFATILELFINHSSGHYALKEIKTFEQESTQRCLDFFKSIGNGNDETGVIKFQLELIPEGETLGGLIVDQLHENLCVISYWGKSIKKIQRIGEITNAFVLGRFKENITSKNELVNFIMSKLNQGETALNGTKLESVDKKVIDDHISSLEPLENLTPTKFYKDWFIEIMRRYEGDLKSDL